MNNELVATRDDGIQAITAIQDNYVYQTRGWVAWMRETGNHIDEIGITSYFKWLNDESKLAAGTIRSRRQAVKKRVRTLYHFLLSWPLIWLLCFFL